MSGKKRGVSKKARRSARDALQTSRVTCERCSAPTTDMEGHNDRMHVNRIAVDIRPGESLTVNRSGGLFHCPWCATTAQPGRRTRLASAQAMRDHLQSCDMYPRYSTETTRAPALEPTPHVPGSSRRGETGPPRPPSRFQALPSDPREVTFSTEVTIIPADANEPVETEVIRSSPTIASLAALLAADEGVNPLDEEP